MINHRRIGFAEVRKRGRMSNHNGNITLFLSSVLVASMPQLVLYSGKSRATTVYFTYIWLSYMVLYFTTQIAQDPRLRARNYNETHVAGVVSGLLLGLLLRKRIKL